MLASTAAATAAANGSAPSASPDLQPDPWQGLSRDERRTRRRDLEALGDEIALISAHNQAATYRLLTKIREFDHWKAWHEQGFRSCAEWLAWRTGITPGAAREKVRVARALATLPVMSRALARGALSYSAARALTRVATPENEDPLVDVALCTPAVQLERLVRRWRAVGKAAAELAAEEAERHRRREVWLSPADDGSWRLHGRLDPEVGAVLLKAFEAAEERLYVARRKEEAETESEAGEPEPEAPPRPSRWADALGLVAEAALGEGLGEGTSVVGRAERFQVVVRVSRETLSGEEADAPTAPGAACEAEPPAIDGGPHLFEETARRLACDTSLVQMTRDGAGSVLDVGRKRRTVPPALRRALDARDRRCRFPGCGCRYCDAHHIVPWARGGETRLENLVLLCRHHHRLVHEGGWSLEWTDEGEPRFLRPDGRELPALPPSCRVSDDPLAGWEREHRDVGIDAWTATPDWDGVPMDVDFALEALAPPHPGRAPSTKESPVPPSLPPLKGPESQRPPGVDASPETWRLRPG